MENASDGKHPEKIERDCRPNGKPAPTRPQDAQATKMQNEKRNAANQVHAVGLGANRLRRFERVIGIDPLHERGAKPAQELGKGGQGAGKGKVIFLSLENLVRGRKPRARKIRAEPWRGCILAGPRGNVRRMFPVRRPIPAGPRMPSPVLAFKTDFEMTRSTLPGRLCRLCHGLRDIALASLPHSESFGVLA